MKKKSQGQAMREHIPDERGCCVVCGQRNVAPHEACPGVPAEEEVAHDYRSPSAGFLPASQEYDPWQDAADESFENPDAFTHDPDRAACNVLCPVCLGRPCLAGCRLGLSAADITELSQKFEGDDDGC